MRVDNALCSLIDKTIKDTVFQTAGIQLQNCQKTNSGDEDIYTVCTRFDGGYRAEVAFSAEYELMKKIAENMLEEPVTDLEEMLEYLKELINILCGHIVGCVYYKTRLSARFQPPCLMEGENPLEDTRGEDVIKVCYKNDCSKEPCFYMIAQ